MAKLSLEAWKSWKEAQQKYDYFVVGLTTTLFAFLGSKYQPEPIGFSQNTFELASLFFLCISILVGVFKLESDISLLSTNLRKIEAREHLDVINKIINAPGPVIDGDTRKEISKTDALGKQEMLAEYISKSGKGLTIIGKRSELMFRARNVSLIIGFVLLITSKFVGLYALS